MDEIRKLLIRSFDEELPATEKLKLAEALHSSEELRHEKSEIQEMRSLLQQEDMSFDAGFADRVMGKIYPTTREFLAITPEFYKVFKRFALSGVAAIILFLISIYIIDGSISLETLYGLSDYSPEEIELALFTIEDFN